MRRNPAAAGRGLAAAAALAGALLLPAAAGFAKSPPKPENPTALPAPAIPNVPALPGPIAPAAKPSSSIKPLNVTPLEGVTGAPVTISASGLPANKPVTITWSTTKITWEADPRVDSVDYLGLAPAEALTVVLATATTNAQGSFEVSVKAPNDFGGKHEIYADVEGARAGCRRVHHRPIGHDQPEEGPDRDTDHDRLSWPRLVAVRRRRLAELRQPFHWRRDGVLDARQRAVYDPRLGPGRQAHDPDRRLDHLQLSQHPAVADPLGRRQHLHGRSQHVHVHRDEGQGPPEAGDGMAGQRRPDVRLTYDAAGERRGRGQHRRRHAHADAGVPCRPASKSAHRGWRTRRSR